MKKKASASSAEKVTLIIPALNEERTIGQVIEGVRKECPEARIVVVDDGSTDGTYGVCKREKVEIVRHKRRLGLGKTIKEGLEKATGITVLIDADGECFPEDIGKLLEKLKDCDLVLGSRFLGKKPEMELVHKLGNIFFSGLVSLIIKQRITDAQTGLRALSEKARKKIKLSGGYTYTQEMLILAKKNGLRIGEVSAGYEKRKFGESRIAKNPFLYGIRVLPLIVRSAIRKD